MCPIEESRLSTPFQPACGRACREVGWSGRWETKTQAGPQRTGQASPIAPSNGVSPKGVKKQGGVCLAQGPFSPRPLRPLFVRHSRLMGGDASTGGDTRRRQLLDRPNPRPLYETQYFYAKSEAHGLTFTFTNYYYNNEKWVCAIDDISRKSAICTMAGYFGGSYSTPEKCILTFKTHQKGGKCIPHHMKLDCGKPPYVETSKFSKIDYRDIPHKDIIQQDLEECNTCDKSTLLLLGGTKYTSCDPEPFEGKETIFLFDIATDITENLSGDPADVTVVSFPCMTDSSQQVDFNFGFGQLLKLEEVRFANWVTGPDGFFFVRTLLLPFLSHLLLRALPYVLLQQYGVSSTEHTQNIW